MDQWAAIRLEWEEDPTASLRGLVDKHGVNNAEISHRSRNEGWSKRGQLGAINESAQRLADNALDADGNQTQHELSSARLATRQESEVVRAAVLIRHRGEWAELEAFRRTALKAMKDAHEAGDRNAWSITKLTADTAKANLQALEIKQAGEARAWGLDAKAEEEIVITNPRRFEGD